MQANKMNVHELVHTKTKSQSEEYFGLNCLIGCHRERVGWEDGTYEYLNGKQIYNSGKWYSKRKGWVKVYLYNWKDIPEFKIFDCKYNCAVFINYNAGELEFQPDLSMYNFSKVGEE